MNKGKNTGEGGEKKSEKFHPAYGCCRGNSFGRLFPIKRFETNRLREYGD